MIIIRGNRVGVEGDAQFILTQIPNGFVVLDKQSGQSFEFDKTKLEFAPDIAYLTRNIWGAPVLFWQSEVGHTRDGYSSICLRKKINMAAMQAAYAMFCVDELGDAHAIIYGDTFVEQTTDLVEFEPVDGTATGCDLFEAKIPGIKAFMNYSRAKVAALARFNPVDAVSGLENQIDLLTAAVKLLIEEMPADKRPAWWPAFEVAALGDNASFAMRGIDNAIGNVEAEKVKARETQNAFFAKLTNG